MLIIIRGNAGSGKSTIAEKLREIFPNPKKVAVIHTEIFYWEIVKGDSVETVMENTKRIIDNYLKNKYHVILEGTLSNKDKEGNLYINSILKIAKKYKVLIKQFFFETSFSELERREKSRNKISLEQLRHLYDKTLKTKRKDEILIDTSDKSTNEVLNEVRKHLSKK